MPRYWSSALPARGWARRDWKAAICSSRSSPARRLYYGAADAKSGGVAHGARVFTHPQCHHAPDVYDGLAAQDAQALLTSFFDKLRQG